MPFLLGPALTVGLAVGGHHVDGRLTTISVDAGVAIGAIAVLAAVHVLSVQIAATALPSPIASTAVAPTGIRVAYGVAVAMLAVALLDDDSIEPALSWHPGAVSAVLLVVLVVMIIAVTIRALRNLSRAATSVLAADRAIPRALQAGEHVAAFGVQRRKVNEAVESQPYLRSHITPDDSTRRQRLRAGRAGFLAIDVGRLQALQDRGPWKNGDLRLDLLVSAGTQVTSGTEYASVVPTSQATLHRDEFAAAARAFEVVSCRDVERLTELCAALFDQVLALTDGGDQAGAHHVHERLIRLLNLHVIASRGEQWEQPGNPPSPALLAVVNRALVGVTRSADEESRELCIGVLQAMLASGGENDPVVRLIAFRAVPEPPPSLAQLSVLYEAGQQSIALGSRSDVHVIQRGLHAHLGGTDDAARYVGETAARLVQYAAIADPVNSRQAWTSYREASEAAQAPDCVANFARIGAAALRVGNLSLAVEAALGLPQSIDLAKLRAQVHDKARAEHENMLSRLGGRLLGEDAETRLAKFIDAAEVFRTPLVPPALRGSSSPGGGSGARTA